MRRDRFTIHHVVLLVVLFGIAVMLGDDTVLPTTAKLPGMLILGIVGVWAAMKSLPSHHELAVHPSRLPPPPSVPRLRKPRGD